MFTLMHEKPTSRVRSAAQPTLARSASPLIQRAPSCACGGTCPRCMARQPLAMGSHAATPAVTGEPLSDSPEAPSVMPGQPVGTTLPGDPLPGLPAACVVKSALPFSRSGIVRSSTGSVREDFEVRVEWSNSTDRREETSYCAAECGEYHQLVKGFMKFSSNKDGSNLQDVSGKVFGGKPLDQNTFQEDGLDSNPKARYGHRNEKRTMDESYSPNRATGDKYVGRDSPGVLIGTFADFDLTFVGVLADTCNGTEKVSEPWRVSYRGVIRP